MIDKRKTKRKGTVYEVRLRDGAGREYSKTFDTLTAAKAYEATEKADMARGVWMDPRLAKVTFDVWAQEWLDNNPTKRKKSVATDRAMIRLYMSPTLGNLPLGSIKPLRIQKLVATWCTMTKPGTDETYAPSSIVRIYAVLHAIFQAAIDADLLARTPCKGVNLPDIMPVKRYPLSRAELADLSQALGDQYGTLMYTAAVLGLRFGECSALTVEQLDFRHGSLTVAASQVEVSGEIDINDPKSHAGHRTLTVPEPLMIMLSAQLARRGLTAADGDAYVFASPTGCRLRYSNWRTREWLPALDKTGLAGLRLGSHDLRRACARALMSAGVDPVTAMERLGQSDPRMLKLYARGTEERHRDAADRLGTYFLDGAPEDEAAEQSA